MIYTIKNENRVGVTEKKISARIIRENLCHSWTISKYP